jgi:hypothetical protein
MGNARATARQAEIAKIGTGKEHPADPRWDYSPVERKNPRIERAQTSAPLHISQLRVGTSVAHWIRRRLG